ncbi:MAG: CBS domain-containing protein [Myxococcales bacterium]|nr:CBS domain-containing protein [Myxococcales bacterium]
MSNADHTPVRAIMQEKIVTISAHESLSTVEDIMRLGRVRHMPVVSGGKLVGVVSERDLLRNSLSSLSSHRQDERKAFLYAVEIGRVMSQPAIVIDPDASIKQAARTMADAKIGCLPVVLHDELIGLVTETDVLKWVAHDHPEDAARRGSSASARTRSATSA